MICVDGDTSTNDTVLVLANGEANNDYIDEHSKDWQIFVEAFEYVNKYLAKEIIKDGEGAGTFISVNIKKRNRWKKMQKLLAKSIVKSSLVKAAFFGSDANFGRILCAMGYSTGYLILINLI